MTNVDAVISNEQNLIGILIKNPIEYDNVNSILSHKDFTEPYYQMIYIAIGKLIEDGENVDIMTIWEKIGSNKISINRLEALMELERNSTTGAQHYARRVVISGTMRRLEEIGKAMQVEVQHQLASALEIAEKAEREISEAVHRVSIAPITLSEAVERAVMDIMHQSEQDTRKPLLNVGIQGIDDLTKGLDEGNMMVVAARTSVGKTATAITMLNSIIDQGKSGLFFSMEMSNREVANRFIALRTGIHGDTLRQSNLSDHAWEILIDEQIKLKDRPLWIDSHQGASLMHIKSTSRSIQRKHGLDLIVVDYLGKVAGKGENRVEILGEIARGLKSMAMELKVPVIVLAQLNRNVENEGRKPYLSDIKGSGEIEQEADVIVLLHRMERAEETKIDTLNMDVRKNRNGDTGEFLVDLHRPTGRITPSNKIIGMLEIKGPTRGFKK